MRKPAFCECENKWSRSDQRLVFVTQIVHSPYFFIPKFQVPSHLLWPYSRVCVRPDRKPRRHVFSCRGSHGLRSYDTQSCTCNRLNMLALNSAHTMLTNHIAYWVIFHAFCRLLIFFKIYFLKKKKIQEYHHNVKQFGLPRLSADDTGRQRVNM